MRTTLVLDDGLVRQAREILGGRSLRAMVQDSLQEAIKARQRQKLIESLGTWDLAITEEELHRLRQDKALDETVETEKATS
jgi:hypothetical protein